MAAPGVQIDSLWVGGGRRKLSGTSQAAAMVAGELLPATHAAAELQTEFDLEQFLARCGKLHPSLLTTTRNGRYLPPIRQSSAEESPAGR